MTILTNEEDNLMDHGGQLKMIELSGSPSEVGRRWGSININSIVSDLDTHYLGPAKTEGISRKTQEPRLPAPFLRCLTESETARGSPILKAETSILATIP